ncbi:MAG: hypothetical protein IPM99_17615 [Rubrivivax sp.]|nr:hypothetical protein [Rubrivivax sp.]
MRERDRLAVAVARRCITVGAWARPRLPSLTIELLAATVAGAPLDEADVVSILRNWTAGDPGSLSAALGVVVHFLASHPDGQRDLRVAPCATAAAIDGCLRIDDPFVVNRRGTTASVRIGDHGLCAGTRIDLDGTSANRDEAVFGNPDACRPAQHAPHNLVRLRAARAPGRGRTAARHWRGAPV